MTNTSAIVSRVILEVAGTIATNGIQDLDHTERGGVLEQTAKDLSGVSL